MSVETEREWEIHEQLEAVRQQQEECGILQKELETMEEETHWQNQRVKMVNDDIMDGCFKDERLRNLLIEKEDMMRQKASFEKAFFEECRDLLHSAENKAEEEKENYEKELKSIRISGSVK